MSLDSIDMWNKSIYIYIYGGKYIWREILTNALRVMVNNLFK